MPDCRIKMEKSRAYRMGVRGTREKSSEYFGIPVKSSILVITL